MRHIFTSESVTEGHPDKMADQISDAVLDAVMAEDPTGRVACEVLVTTGICVVSGTGTVSEKRLVELVRENFQLTPKGMIESLKLRRPIYRKTASCGHFGRTEDTFTWEATAKAATLKDAAQAAAVGRT